MDKSLSERYIMALEQLPQFMPHQADSNLPPYVIHVLTGARVSALVDPLGDENGILLLQFPGAVPFEVIGALYLKLQLSEAAAHYQHAPGEGNGKIADEATQLYEHLSRKYALD